MSRILLTAALLPAFVLMVMIYKQDRREKEPVSLLTKLFFAGCVSCFPALILEMIGERILNSFEVGGLLFVFVQAFLIVGVAEEGSKRFFLRKITFNNPNFNTTFDGIVYAAFVSLGFAAFENIQYVASYGLGVAFSRALLSIPGHMTFGVFMGYYYSRWKIAHIYHLNLQYYKNMSIIIPVLLHGFFDFCLMSNSDIFSSLFFVFVVILDISVFKTIKKESQRDSYFRLF